MKEEGILLSEKHGVNSSISHCFICGDEVGLILFGKLKDDKEAPKHVSDPSVLCDRCKKHLDDGNKFVLEVADESTEDNPIRTGNFVGLKGTALPDMKSPVSYCVHSLFQKMFGEFLK